MIRKFQLLPVPDVFVENIEYDILLLLPPTMLVQMSHECQEWRGIISEPVFCKRNLRLAGSQQVLLVLRDSYPIDVDEDEVENRHIVFCRHPISNIENTLNMNDNSDFHYWDLTLNEQVPFPDFFSGMMLDSLPVSDGLFCYNNMLDNPNLLMIWNPTLGKYKEMECWRPITKSYVLVPSLGYSNHLGAYVFFAVFLNLYEKCDGTFFQMYNLRDQTCTNLGEFPSKNLISSIGLFLDNTLYWLDTSYSTISYDYVRKAYNDPVEFPDNFFPEEGGDYILDTVSQLCLLKDKVSILSTIRFQPNDSFSHSIWTLEIEGGNWNLMYNIQFPNMDFSNDPLWIIPLFMDDDDKLIMLLQRPLDFAIFDVTHSIFRRHSIFRLTHITSLMVCALYQESLVWPF
ncbi:uncharacterized protein LOC131630603 [Vicia villosa]|uniref:uncharacterized protein LOC131630603 n=1 Tax=Vicia villosa TaxID=3911 RepID=UPI00273B94C0|nr:uncharacterized protein LOC131630603 [Vicia villosa]